MGNGGDSNLACLSRYLHPGLKEDKKEAGRIDRAADRAAAMGEDDELAQYNRYLSKLNQRDTNQ